MAGLNYLAKYIIKNAKFPFLTINVNDTLKKTKKEFGENHITSEIYTFIPNNNNE